MEWIPRYCTYTLQTFTYVVHTWTYLHIPGICHVQTFFIDICTWILVYLYIQTYVVVDYIFMIPLFLAGNLIPTIPQVQPAQGFWLPSGQLWHCSSRWPAWQQRVWGKPVAVAVWTWKAAPGWSVMWGDWWEEGGCPAGAEPARSWDSQASQGWLGLTESEVWFWSCTGVSCLGTYICIHSWTCMYHAYTHMYIHELVCT